MGVLLLVVITYAAFYVLAMLTLNYQTKRATLKAAQSNNDLFSATAKQMAAGAVYLSEQRTEQGTVRFKAMPRPPKQPKPEIVEPLALPLPEIKNSLLNDIQPLQRLLIVGGQNAGKTTLLKHIAHQRSAAGNVLILDSHNTVGKWANHYRIVGHGRDYSAIETELKNLVEIMDSRYKELASGRIGERGHELITVISDEFTTIAENIKNLDAVLLPLLTESRKVGIDFIVACHSETASSLGLKGRFDLKKNFDAVLRLKNISGKRIIDLDNGEAIINYQHCGVFTESYPIKPPQINNYVSANDFTNKLQLILNNPIEELTIEKKITSAYWQLKTENKPISLNAICLAVYGYKKGDKLKLIARILEQNSLETTN